MPSVLRIHTLSELQKYKSAVQQNQHVVGSANVGFTLPWGHCIGGEHICLPALTMWWVSNTCSAQKSKKKKQIRKTLLITYNCIHKLSSWPGLTFRHTDYLHILAVTPRFGVVSNFSILIAVCPSDVRQELLCHVHPGAVIGVPRTEFQVQRNWNNHQLFTVYYWLFFSCVPGFAQLLSCLRGQKYKTSVLTLVTARAQSESHRKGHGVPWLHLS